MHWCSNGYKKNWSHNFRHWKKKEWLVKQQYVDALEKFVIVPLSYEFITAPYAASWTGKKASVLTCISPNWLMCQPQYAIHSLNLELLIVKYFNIFLLILYMLYHNYFGPSIYQHIFLPCNSNYKNTCCIITIWNNTTLSGTSFIGSVPASWHIWSKIVMINQNSYFL